jgi:hypothetical protein
MRDEKNWSTSYTGNVDRRSPNGWSFSGNTYRVSGTGNVFADVKSPSGSKFYNVMQGSSAYMTTQLENLTIGKSYQLRGFVSDRPWSGPSSFEVRLDNSVILRMNNLADVFVPFGPITVLATAPIHELGFYVSPSGDYTVMVDGLTLVSTP